MRNYFKVFRTLDFTTVFGKLAAGADLTQFEKLAMEPGEKTSCIQQHNFIAGVNSWYGTDGDPSVTSGVNGNIVQFISGIGLANRIYNLVPYAEHPAQDGPYGPNGILSGQKPPSAKSDVSGAAALVKNFISFMQKLAANQPTKRLRLIVENLLSEFLAGQKSITRVLQELHDLFIVN